MKRNLFYFTVALALFITLTLVSTSDAKACEEDEKRHQMVIIECLAPDENGDPMIIGVSNECAEGNSHCVYHPCPDE